MIFFVLNFSFIIQHFLRHFFLRGLCIMRLRLTAFWATFKQCYLFSSILKHKPYLSLFTCTWVAKGPICFYNCLFSAVITSCWSCKWLVFLVFNFPLDLFEASIAKAIKRCICYLYCLPSFIIKLKFCFVLVFLCTLLMVSFLCALHFIRKII